MSGAADKMFGTQIDVHPLLRLFFDNAACCNFGTSLKL